MLNIKTFPILKKRGGYVKVLILVLSLLFVTSCSNSAVGDINGDGSTDIKDLLLLRRYLVGADAPDDLRPYDVNNDGVINENDILYLQKILLN